jgi:hypothetical protein
MARHDLSVPLAIVQIGLIIIQLCGLFKVHHIVSFVAETSRVQNEAKSPLEATPPTSVNVDFSSLELQMKEFERRVMETVSTLPASPASPPAVPAAANPDTRESIAAIMARTGTDKLSRHAYDRYYELHFKEFRDKKDLSILEIGAQSGKSIQLWSEYFSNPSAIHGVSYGEDTQNVDQKKVVCDWNPAACKNVAIFNGDQSDPVFLKTITDKYKYDIIVDDGSHFPPHQIISLQHLFSSINPGGLYVLEDIETSYWNEPGANLYGYSISAGIGASPKVNAIEKLKQFIDVMMRFHMAHPGLHIFPDDDKFFSITFGQGIAIIRKSTDSEMQHPPSVPVAPVIHSGVDEWAAMAMATNP